MPGRTCVPVDRADGIHGVRGWVRHRVGTRPGRLTGRTTVVTVPWAGRACLLPGPGRPGLPRTRAPLTGSAMSTGTWAGPGATSVELPWTIGRPSSVPAPALARATARRSGARPHVGGAIVEAAVTVTGRTAVPGARPIVGPRVTEPEASPVAGRSARPRPVVATSTLGAMWTVVGSSRPGPCSRWSPAAGSRSAGSRSAGCAPRRPPVQPGLRRTWRPSPSRGPCRSDTCVHQCSPTLPVARVLDRDPAREQLVPKPV